MLRYAFLALALTLGVIGCSAKQDITEDWPVEKLYRKARDAMLGGDYTQASEYYKKLEARAPFGVYGQQALMDSAYVHYKSERIDAAIETCNRFIQLYPQHKYVDYVYYLRGLAGYQRSRGLAVRLLNIDLSQRDPGSYLQAFQGFSELVRRFPQSRYAADARQHMVYLRSLLAEHEIEVAHYYLRRGAYVAAANRARYLLEHYPRTASVPEALAIMARAYRVLQLEELATDALRVLRKNYPDHPQIAAIEALRVTP